MKNALDTLFDLVKALLGDVCLLYLSHPDEDGGELSPSNESLVYCNKSPFPCDPRAFTVIASIEKALDPVSLVLSILVLVYSRLQGQLIW